MAKKYEIRTNNDELFKKFNQLNLYNEIFIWKKDVKGLTTILNKINKRDKRLEVVKKDDIIIIRKKKPIDFKVYLLK